MTVSQSIASLGWRSFLTCPTAALVIWLSLPWVTGWLQVVGVITLWVLLAATFLGMLVVGATSWSRSKPARDQDPEALDNR